MTGNHSDEPPLPEALWEALRRDEPDAHAIDRAYLRFTTPRPVRAFKLGLSRWLVAGFATSWGVVYAATGDPLFGAGLRAEPSSAPRGVPSAASMGQPGRSPLGARSIESTSVVVPSAVAPNGVASSAVAPSPAPLVPVTGETDKPSSTRVTGSALPVDKEEPALDPQWQHVARALRRHDYAAAQSALHELETAGTPADRDAASLSLAQVLIARGRAAEARSRLERLSVSAHSALVRDKAKSLLANNRLPGERSSGAAADTQ